MIVKAVTPARPFLLLPKKGPQASPSELVEHQEHSGLSLFEVPIPAFQVRVGFLDNALQAHASRPFGLALQLLLHRLQAFLAHLALTRLEAIAQEVEALP